MVEARHDSFSNLPSDAWSYQFRYTGGGIGGEDTTNPKRWPGSGAAAQLTGPPDITTGHSDAQAGRARPYRSRAKIVHSAFRVRGRFNPSGRTVLLVDDVSQPVQPVARRQEP